MQPLLQQPGSVWLDPYHLTVFPRLMLAHANPANRLQTDTFCWRWDTYDQAVSNLTRFRARDNFLLTETEIENMIRELGLQHITGVRPASRPMHDDLLDRILNELQDVQDNLRILSSKVDVLMSRAEDDWEAEPGRQAPLVAPQPAPDDARTARLFSLVEQATRNLVGSGAKLVFPNIHSEMSRLLGEKLEPGQYAFPGFKALMQAAEKQNHVRLIRVGTVDYAHPLDYDGPAPQPPPQLDDLSPDELANLIRLLDQIESSRPYVTVSYSADYLERVGFLGLKINYQTRLIREALARGILQPSSYSLENRLTGLNVPIRTITLNFADERVSDALRGQ
ncbi:MAG: hypothetical protein HY784_03265 [Chloroflexi bacterium]|nr:hypothetical protein [Chloroflexota bacterium]